MSIEVDVSNVSFPGSPALSVEERILAKVREAQENGVRIVQREYGARIGESGVWTTPEGECCALSACVLGLPPAGEDVFHTAYPVLLAAALELGVSVLFTRGFIYGFDGAERFTGKGVDWYAGYDAGVRVADAIFGKEAE
jgi:hypothetical protein